MLVFPNTERHHATLHHPLHTNTNDHANTVSPKEFIVWAWYVFIIEFKFITNGFYLYYLVSDTTDPTLASNASRWAVITHQTPSSLQTRKFLC